MKWKTTSHFLHLKSQSHIMGIINVSPDSFFKSFNEPNVEMTVNQALKQIEAGATIIDIGGESSRPGAQRVNTQIELSRVIPVVKALRRQSDCLISIDTQKSEVAKQALQLGANIINDITGLRGDPNMISVCKEYGAGIVVMHMQGMPSTMQENPFYQDIIKELNAFFLQRFQFLISKGIDPETICLDPGIGFGKTPNHNLTLLKNLEQFAIHQRPLLVGISRKSFIAHCLGKPDFSERLWPSVGLTAYLWSKGVNILRSHDVSENVQALRMTEAILQPPI